MIGKSPRLMLYKDLEAKLYMQERVDDIWSKTLVLHSTHTHRGNCSKVAYFLLKVAITWLGNASPGLKIILTQ